MFTERLTAREEAHAWEKDFQEQHDSEQRQRRREWRNHVKPREAALREGRCEPALLHQLAEVYFGRFIDVEGATPLARLRDLFGGDEPLIEAILEGLRGSVGRSDVPDDAEIIRLWDREPDPLLGSSVPGRIGRDRRGRAGRRPSTRDEKQMRQALAFLYAEPPDLTSRWYERTAISNPEVVVDVLVRSVRSEMRSGKSRFSGVYRLEDSEEIARLAVSSLAGIVSRALHDATT